MKKRHFQTTLLALAASAVLVACGGGGTGETAPSSKISSVKVFGDSLADTGVFGAKATIQTADNFLFVERIAMNYGQTLCSYYMPTGADSFAPNTAKAGCTNYAIGGGVINSATLANPTSNQKGIMLQLAAGATTGYGASDLVIIDGGGNDSANLVGAFLAAQQGSTAGLVGLLGTMLTPAQMGALNPANPATLLAAGNQYMTALADKFYDAVTAQVLNKGATKVVFVNIPDITLTPRFQMVIGGIAAASGAATAQQLQGAFQGWVKAFNAQLAARASAETRIAVIDIYTNFQDQVANPAQFSLSNAKDASCPITGMGGDGLPSYSFAACTAAAAKPGWQSWLFSDGFHPTPYGHQLASQLIARALAQKGWL